jgi:hypothetical protein
MKRSGVVASAILIAASSAWAQTALRLKARSGPEFRGTPVAARPATHFLLQFPEYPGVQVRGELERRGMRVLEYVPDNGVLVAAAELRLDGLGLSWAGALDVGDKISPQLDRQVAGPLLVEFHSDARMTPARAMLAELGFEVIENASLLAGQLVVMGAHSRIEALASKDEVKYILPAAGELAAGEAVAGCAGALTEAGTVGDYALMGKGWPKDESGNFALRYFIRSITDKLDAAVVRAEIERALREWTRYTNLMLAPGDREAANRSIDILFARRAHGDPYSFDGPGGMLAHTFYPAPPNAEPLAGDMHLDADEAWSTGAAIDLYSVALHEAGHALGLGHSDRPGTVMYPYYKQSTGLADDDIAAIQALYGSAGVLVPAPTPTPTRHQFLRPCRCPSRRPLQPPLPDLRFRRPARTRFPLRCGSCRRG